MGQLDSLCGYDSPMRVETEAHPGNLHLSALNLVLPPANFHQDCFAAEETLTAMRQKACRLEK